MSLAKIYREVDYFFLRMFLYALFRPAGAYQRMRTFARGKGIDEWRREKVERNLEAVFGSRFDEKDRGALSGRFLEVLACDNIDCFIWFLHTWNHIRRDIEIQNKEVIEKIIEEKRGCVVLSAHFGGCFFIFEILRELRGRPQVLGRPVRYEYFKPDFIRWLYFRFRAWCLKGTVGEPIIYTEEKGTKDEILRKLREGYQIFITFDVPPHFTKGPVGKVLLLNRLWNYPTGFLELISSIQAPIVPLFSYLTEQGKRVFTFFPEYQVSEGGAKEALQRCVSLFEDFVSKRPEQWFFWDDAQVFWS